MSTRPPPPRRPLPPPPPPPPTDLSPLRAHYLKKSLVSLQLRSELDALARAPTLAHLGPPFAPSQPRLDLPLLKYIFRHFVLSFPFLAAAPNDFYSEKLQPFVDSLFARNLSSLDDPDPQDPAPRKLIAKIERNLAMLITSTIKLDEPEDVLRLSQADLQSLERAVNKRLAKRTPRDSLFHVNIVSVRAVTERGRVRSRVHEVCPPLPVLISLEHPLGVHHSHHPLSRQTSLRLPPLRRFQDACKRGLSLVPPLTHALTRASSAKPTPTRSSHHHPPRIAQRSMSPYLPPPLQTPKTLHQTTWLRIPPPPATFMPPSRMQVNHHPVSLEKRTVSLFVHISIPCSQPLPFLLLPSSVHSSSADPPAFPRRKRRMHSAGKRPTALGNKAGRNFPARLVQESTNSGKPSGPSRARSSAKVMSPFVVILSS